MKKAMSIRKLIKNLLTSQRLAVLATQARREPYGNLVAFRAADHLRCLLFATNRTTRKYRNMMKNPRVAMVIDNRSNREADFREAVAVTATGVVKEASGPEKVRLQKLYLSKHPYLKDFLYSANCALLKVEVETYIVVSQFQNVTELRMKPGSPGGHSKKAGGRG